MQCIFFFLLRVSDGRIWLTDYSQIDRLVFKLTTELIFSMLFFFWCYLTINVTVSSTRLYFMAD